MSFRNELGYSKWDYDSYIEKLFTERVTFGKHYDGTYFDPKTGIDHFFGFQMEHSEIESGIPDFLSGNYLINSLFYRFIIDGRDDKMDAKNGYYSSLYIEKSMKQIGSEIDYLKVLGEARYIKEFDPTIPEIIIDSNNFIKVLNKIYACFIENEDIYTKIYYKVGEHVKFGDKKYS